MRRHEQRARLLRRIRELRLMRARVQLQRECGALAEVEARLAACGAALREQQSMAAAQDSARPGAAWLQARLDSRRQHHAEAGRLAHLHRQSLEEVEAQQRVTDVVRRTVRRYEHLLGHPHR